MPVFVAQSLCRRWLQKRHITVEYEHVPREIAQDRLRLSHRMSCPELGFLPHTGDTIGLADLAHRLRLIAHDHHQPLWQQRLSDIKDIREQRSASEWM